MVRTLLVTLAMVSASIWLGGLVCIALVVREARLALDETSQLALMRAVGRRYGVVGSASLLVALVTYLLLAGVPSSWSALTFATVVVWVFLCVLSWRGVVQARSMSALRRSSLATGGGPAASSALHKGRRVANALRVAMALTSGAVVVLVAAALAR